MNLVVQKLTEPFSITFVKCNLSKNEGGQIETLHRQLSGPKKKNVNDKYMIGLQNVDTGEIIHIYIHSILSIKLHNNHKFKLVLN